MLMQVPELASVQQAGLQTALLDDTIPLAHPRSQTLVAVVLATGVANRVLYKMALGPM